MLSPGLRKLALTLHVGISVAFPGAVGCFLALAVVGLMSNAAATAHAAYAAMDLITSTVIVPLCVASLLTGLISSLGTPWGLFRYWWIVVKLVGTLVSTIILIVHLRPIGVMATVATPTHLASTQLQLLLAAGAALAALALFVALSIYKPRGLTHYGARRLGELKGAP
jgi:hypothetical protein